MYRKSFVLLLLSAVPCVVRAQTNVPATQMLDAKTLRTVGDELEKEAGASPTGFATKILITRPDSTVQLVVRVHTGQSEWHHDFADLLIGMEGTGSVAEGGEIVGGKEVSPGEIRGTSIAHATTQTFGPGDVLRVEPQVAHFVTLAPGTTLRYLAVKTHAAN